VFLSKHAVVSLSRCRPTDRVYVWVDATDGCNRQRRLRQRAPAGMTHDTRCVPIASSSSLSSSSFSLFHTTSPIHRHKSNIQPTWQWHNYTATLLRRRIASRRSLCLLVLCLLLKANSKMTALDSIDIEEDREALQKVRSGFTDRLISGKTKTNMSQYAYRWNEKHKSILSLTSYNT